MSTPDQLLLARISGICGRHCGRGVIDDLDAAVAELRGVAGNRPDLLAAHAGISIETAEEGLSVLAPRFWAEADLCVAAGADQSAIRGGIEVGRKRAGDAQAVPYTGLTKMNS